MNGSLSEKAVTTVLPKNEKKRWRVAAYCRVSTEEETQQGSLAAQQTHWQSVIAERPEWTLTEIYVESGVSATHAHTRPQLMRLIDEASNGRVDLILTKSISRFSRNTVDCLSLVRVLSALGVGVFFEKENLNTARMDSELFLSLLSCFAAEESRSISKNVQWGYSKRFQQGQFKYKRPPYGYNSEDGALRVNAAEAEAVRELFARALRGEKPSAIAADFNLRALPTKYGEAQWHSSTVTAILRNVTYTGDALFQKTYKDAEYVERCNEGQRDRYYCADHHEAIVSREVYILANERLGRVGIRSELEAWQAGVRREAGVLVIRAAEAEKGEGAPAPVRVAAYCRVSTSSEEQENSYEAQCAHYHSRITAQQSWTLVDIYADEGITGTSTAHRERFKQLMADCEARRVDLILTKSISRFARNTLDCLTHIRRLKALGIAVEFEKEAINTLDAKGEILLTIMASIAQQESQSISQNVRLGIQYRFQQGRGMVNEKRLLGYDKSPSSRLTVNACQAALVRRIFRLFLEGQGCTHIANTLSLEGAKTGCGGAKWYASTVRYILQNSVYTGDLLMQKTYVADFLNHRSVKNAGQLPQYLAENAHDPIVPKAIFAMAQDELHRRSVDAARGVPQERANREALSGRLYCPCGARMRKLRRKSAVWRCPQCGNEMLESDVKAAVLRAVNRLPEYRGTLETALGQAIAQTSADAYARALRQGEAMRLRLALEAIDRMEGRCALPISARACATENDFWNCTRRVRRAGPIADWIEEDIALWIDRVILGERVRFRAGIEAEWEM